MTTVLQVTIRLTPQVAESMPGLTHEFVAEVIRERLLHGNAGAYDVTVAVDQERKLGVAREGAL